MIKSKFTEYYSISSKTGAPAKKDLILASAIEVFAEKGFLKATISEISAKGSGMPIQLREMPKC